MPMTMDQMLGKGGGSKPVGRTMEQMTGAAGTTAATPTPTTQPPAKPPTDLEKAKGIVTAPVETVFGVPLETLGAMAGYIEPWTHPEKTWESAKENIQGLKDTVSEMVKSPLSTSARIIRGAVFDPMSYLFGAGHLPEGAATRGVKLAEGSPKAMGEEFKARLDAYKEATNPAPEKSTPPVPKKGVPQPVKDAKEADKRISAEQEAYRLVQKVMETC